MEWWSGGLCEEAAFSAKNPGWQSGKSKLGLSPAETQRRQGKPFFFETFGIYCVMLNDSEASTCAFSILSARKNKQILRRYASQNDVSVRAEGVALNVALGTATGQR